MEAWEVWFPAAEANGLLVARARIDPGQVLWVPVARSCWRSWCETGGGHPLPGRRAAPRGQNSYVRERLAL